MHAGFNVSDKRGGTIQGCKILRSKHYMLKISTILLVIFSLFYFGCTPKNRDAQFWEELGTRDLQFSKAHRVMK